MLDALVLLLADGGEMALYVCMVVVVEREVL